MEMFNLSIVYRGCANQHHGVSTTCVVQEHAEVISCSLKKLKVKVSACNGFRI